MTDKAAENNAVKDDIARDDDWPDGQDAPYMRRKPPRQLALPLMLDIDGWEGPLDLLLDLARQQKVDLLKISILELVDQYLDYITAARAIALELAADYLVMAAWLTYLKSAMLLPDDEAEEISPEELAMRLQLRLKRLEAMRGAGDALLAREQLGRDVLFHGAAPGLEVALHKKWQCSLFDLMRAYGQVQLRNRPVVHMVKSRRVMTLEDALQNLSFMLGTALNWTELEKFLPDNAPDDLRRSARASTFLAALELARLGKLELEQDHVFAPLKIRAAQNAVTGVHNG